MASNNNESASPTRVTIAPVITAEALAGGLSSDRQNPRGVEDKGNLDAGGERIGGADEEEEDDDVEPLDSPLPSVQGSFSFNFQTLPSDLDNMWPSSLDGYNFIGRLFATKTTEAHVAVTRVEDAAPRESTRVGDASDKPSEKPLGAVMKAAASATAAAVSVVVAAQTAQTAQAAAVKASEEAVVAAAATLSINSNLASSSSTAAPPSKPDLTASSTSNDHTESGSLNEAIAASTRAAGAAATAAEAAIATCNAAAVSTNMAGNVSNATAKHVGRFCVVRRINFERVDMSMDSFRRSALVMSPVSRGHSNVLGMFTAFADRHYLYIVQPNMNLGSLVEVMVQRQQYMFDHPDDDSIVLLEEDWISIALAEVCKALQYLHTSGWVHRDVCASNIVLNSDGHIKLADYQTVAVEKPEVPAGESVRLHEFAGTPCWMAPEVMLQAPEGYAPDPVDTWSLGITTLELCMGYAPYAHVSSVRKVFQRTIHDDPPTLATYKEFEFEDRRPRAFSVRLQRFVAALLKKKPAERPSILECMENPFLKAFSGPSSSAANRQILLKQLVQGRGLHPLQEIVGQSPAGDESSLDLDGGCATPSVTKVREQASPFHTGQQQQLKTIAMGERSPGTQASPNLQTVIEGAEPRLSHDSAAPLESENSSVAASPDSKNPANGVDETASSSSV